MCDMLLAYPELYSIDTTRGLHFTDYKRFVVSKTPFRVELATVPSTIYLSLRHKRTGKLFMPYDNKIKLCGEEFLMWTRPYQGCFQSVWLDAEEISKIYTIGESRQVVLEYDGVFDSNLYELLVVVCTPA